MAVLNSAPWPPSGSPEAEGGGRAGGPGSNIGRALPPSQGLCRDLSAPCFLVRGSVPDQGIQRPVSPSGQLVERPHPVPSPQQQLL